MRKLMESDHRWTQYPPLDLERLHVIAQVAESFGLVSHEFGEEGIDRFIIVYKPEFQPDDDEIARLTLRHTRKLDDATVDKILAGPQPDEEGDDQAALAAAARRAQKQKKAEAEDDFVKPEQLHAVGTVKRVRRSTSEAIEDIRQKKKSTIDSLFEAPPSQ